MLRPLRIGITSGDSTGIGPEVVAKALRRIGPKKNIQFILWRNAQFPKRDLTRLKKSFKLVTVRTWAEALQNIPRSPKEILDICGAGSPAFWVEEAAKACCFGHIDAMATAPLAKPTIKASGFNDIGHTDILKRVAKVNHAYMTFLGEKFNVMLASGHLPLKDVSKNLTVENLTAAVEAAQSFVKLLAKVGGKRPKRRPIGVLALNPHAGDSGLIGSEENTLIIPTLEALHKEDAPLEGPLVPDSAFTAANWARYSLYLALYHDQGLGPFKAVHGQNGVHIT